MEGPKCLQENTFIEVCRICLVVNSNNKMMMSLFEPHQEPSIASQLTALADVKVSAGDGLPDRICRGCLAELRAALLFRQKCRHSDRQLRGLPSEPAEVNEEPEENEDECCLDSSSEQEDKTEEFDMSPEIMKQVRAETKMDFVKSANRHFECHDCGKTFKSKCKLIVHVNKTKQNKNLKQSLLRSQNLEQDVKRGFAIMQIQLDKIFEFLNCNNLKKHETVEAIDDTIAQKKIKFPINSIDELDLLEKELVNAEFAKALVQKFSSISGNSGKNKISKIGLFISKSLFTDELLQSFTWKGIKGCAKPPFSIYINIRNCFYKIVHLADNSCTSSEADSFLQNSAIKHSGQRIKRKSCEVNKQIFKKRKTDADMNAALCKTDDPTTNVPDKLQEVLNTKELI